MRTRWVLMVLCLLFLGGCEVAPEPCPTREIMRVRSPDGLVEAVLQSRDCGPTTPVDYRVFIVKAGNKGPGHGLVFWADHAQGLRLEWREDKLLEIKYTQARIFRFTNIWRSEDIAPGEYIVEVRETPLSQGRVLNLPGMRAR